MGRPSKLGICVACDREITICAKGMCNRCYTKARIAENPSLARKKKVNPDSDRITIPKKQVVKPFVDVIEGSLCSVCDRSLNNRDCTVDSDGLQAHGVCSLVKGDRSGWKKPPYATVV